MTAYPGARWRKFDIHTHTPFSSDFMQGRAQEDKDQFTYRDWLLSCMQEGLDCVVVCDHNGGGGIDLLRQEYARLEEGAVEGFRSLVIFPGAEISSTSGIHILAVLDPAKGSSEIASLVGACGYRGGHGDSDACCTRAPIEIVKTIEDEFQGIAILAHVDKEKGFWKMPPQDGDHLLDRDRMLAVEQCDFTAIPPQWVSAKKPLFTRLAGSDCHFRNEEDVPGARYTWIKMGEPSIEGLRLALLDGDSVSVWHSGNPELPVQPDRVPGSYLESLEVEGTKLMGRRGPETLQFSPWMNAVIGGRGTGKSSIVHFLRRLLDQDDALGSISAKEENLLRKVFDDFMRIGRRDDKGVLKPDTRLSLILRHEGHRFRITWKQDGTRSVEAEQTPGSWRPSESQEIRKRFKAQIYSQGQVADLAEKSASLLEHLDGKVGTGTSKEKFQEAQQAVKAILARKRTIAQKATERGALLAQYEDTKLKLAQFEGHDHAATLKEFQRRQRQGAEIQKQREDASTHVEALTLVADQLALADLPEGLFDPSVMEDQEILTLQGALREAVKDVRDKVLAASNDFQVAATAFQEAARTGEWGKAREAIKSKYGELTQGLRAQGILDPSDYGRLVQERQRIEEELKAFDLLQEQLNGMDKELEAAMVQLTEARWAISQRRTEFLQQTLKGNPFIRIEVEPLGRSAEHLESSIRTMLGIQNDAHAQQILQEEEGRAVGEVAEILGDLPTENQAAGRLVEDRVRAFRAKVVEAATGTSKVFGGQLDRELRRQALARVDFLDDVLVWFPEDTLAVRYSPEGKGRHWTPIIQASKGQKSSALLAFLLSHGTDPLVLDQPEDDLDNHLIFSLVVGQLQRLKTQRQVIVITHNANIVVNGDSEFVHVMAYEEGQCKAKQSGCLQENDVRGEICEVMEGGRDAFRLRYRRMNLERV
jgi:hypothetical protein